VDERERAPRGKLIAAFAAIYFIWGSTFLGIRFAVETLPPLLMLAMRYLAAGGILYAWARLRGDPSPEASHWKGALFLGSLLILASNGGVAWAEQVVPSGLAALIVAAEPLFIVLLDWMRRGGSRPTARVAVGLALGFAGVAFLFEPSGLPEEARGGGLRLAALVFASVCWAVGTVYSRRACLPASPFMATAITMLAGGALLLAAGLVTGEASGFNLSETTPLSWVALGYLLVLGSLVGFSAYIWLLRVTTPARVGTHAFVNPVVAVFLGWAVGGETITVRMLLAAGAVVLAVVLIVSSKAREVGSRAKAESPEVDAALGEPVGALSGESQPRHRERLASENRGSVGSEPPP
jgi:drug/metabolite transporter (DMT)-like permease